MSKGWRSFLFESDGTMRRISQRLTLKLWRGEETLPEYAGQSLRNAFVFLELEESRPARIIQIDARLWHFDETGNIRPSLEQRLMETRVVISTLSDRARTSGPIVDLTPRLERKQWVERNCWEPTRKEINQIIDAIWTPGSS